MGGSNARRAGGDRRLTHTGARGGVFWNVKPLELFEIVRELRFWAAESWMAFRRSREIDWCLCAMKNQMFHMIGALGPSSIPLVYKARHKRGSRPILTGCSRQICPGDRCVGVLGVYPRQLVLQEVLICPGVSNGGVRGIE